MVGKRVKLRAVSGLMRFFWVGFFLLPCLLLISCKTLPGNRSESSQPIAQDKKANAFVQAVIDLDYPKIEKALAENWDPNSKNRFGDTVLIWAVFRDQKWLVETLLKRGANPNIAGTYKKSPLHWASESNLIDHMAILVREGAKVDSYDRDFRTPLHTAADKRHLEALKFLLEHGADPNWTDSEGETPLFPALRNDFKAGVEALVLGGADPAVRANNGLTPLRYALETDRHRFFQTQEIRKKMPAIAKLLEGNIQTVESNRDLRPVLDAEAFVELLHLEANRVRQREGLPPFIYDASLGEMARRHAEDMVQRKFFSHVNPSGENPLDRAQRMEFQPPKLASGDRVGFGVAENIFQTVVFANKSSNLSRGVRDVQFDWKTPEKLAKQVISGWMESEGHRKNILSEEFTHEGFGIAILGDRLWVVQNFYYPIQITQVVDGQATKPQYRPEKIAELVHGSINKLRSQNGRSELKWDEKLAEIAFTHCQDMAQRKFFDHFNPEGDDVTARAKRAGYSRLVKEFRGASVKMGLGENLSVGKVYSGRTTSTIGSSRILDYHWVSSEGLAATAIQEWWASPGHRANILNEQYEFSGIGVVIGEDDSIYIVHNFF